jgi:hypothetical protein
VYFNCSGVALLADVNNVLPQYHGTFFEQEILSNESLGRGHVKKLSLSTTLGHIRKAEI